MKLEISTLFKNVYQLKPADYCELKSESGISVGLCEIQGKRWEQEDQLGFSVTSVAKFPLLSAQNKLAVLKNTFQDLQAKDYCQARSVGATACATIAWIESGLLQIWNANLGDSTAFFVVMDEEGVSTQLINELHLPDPEINIKEYERTKETVTPMHGVWRLPSGLMLSRSLGDVSSEAFGLSHDPDIYHIEKKIKSHSKIYLVTACDGLTEQNALSHEDIGSVVAAGMSEGESLEFIAARLVKKAFENGSTDNISVSVAQIDNHPLSTVVFDGHGGSTVSSSANEDFYSLLRQQIDRSK